MAKRFTDNQKWKRPWFRSLGVHAKVLWQYLLDECDHAGVFVADFDLISFQVGFKVDETKLVSWLGDKLVRIDEEKFFIPSFFEFQYGQSDSMFRAKLGALKVLESHGLVDPNGKIKDLTNSYLRHPKSSLSLIERQGIGIGKGIGNELIVDSNSKSSTRVTDAELEAAYRDYPRKEGKSAGIRIARAQIKTPDDLHSLQDAIRNYRDRCRSLGRGREYIKLFSSFMSEWRDWLDPNHGSAEGFDRVGFDWDKYEADKARSNNGNAS